METQKRKVTKKKKSKKIPIAIKVAIVWVIGYLLFSIGAQQIKIVSLDNELKKVEEQSEQESNRTKELKDIKDKLDTPEYKERIAREKLGLLKPDEKVFIDSTQR